MYRRSATARDANGQPVPKIYEDRSNPGTFRLSTDRPVQPAQYQGPARNVASSANDRQQVAGTLQRRAQATRDVKRYQAQRESETAGGGKISPPTKDALRDAYARQTKYGERIGEAAGRQSTARDFPTSKYNVRELTNPNVRGRAGEPDQVFSITPKGGGPERIVVNEAKGPSAGLGVRTGLDGRVYEQGTEGYLRSLIAAYALRNPIVAARMLNALNSGRLDYRLVQARVAPDGSWAGYSVREFNLGP